MFKFILCISLAYLCLSKTYDFEDILHFYKLNLSSTYGEGKDYVQFLGADNFAVKNSETEHSGVLSLDLHFKAEVGSKGGQDKVKAEVCIP
jgi:hypothetical protein